MEIRDTSSINTRDAHSDDPDQVKDRSRKSRIEFPISKLSFGNEIADVNSLEKAICQVVLFGL